MSESAERIRRRFEAGAIADFSARTKLRFTGADRVRFLNGQVTANAQKLAPGESRPACVTTAKGRLCADIWMHATKDALFADADESLRAGLPPRFERYIISDDVTLADVSEELRILHLLGAAIERVELQENAALCSRANRLGSVGLDVWLAASDFEKVQARFLAAGFEMLDAASADGLRIEAGIPRWGFELDENTLPPEAGLERTHIDYDKGCYIGQEVISRLKSIGHVNRQLVGFFAREMDALKVGAEIFAPGDDASKIGVFTSVAWSFALEKPIALGYLKRGSPLGELCAREAGKVGPGRIVFAQNLPFIS